MWFVRATRYDRLIRAIEFLAGRVDKMAIDVSKLTASDQRLVRDVDLLIGLVQDTKAQLADVSKQLAYAIAANDPVGLAQAQAAIDGVVADLDAESAKVETAEAPTGATGP